MKLISDLYPYQRTSRTGAGQATLVNQYLSKQIGRPAVVQSPARVGIFQALRFFGLSRRNNVLVPDFLCQSILNIINVSGFPVKKVDDQTKAVLVFHQWGYPQDMDAVLAAAREKQLVVIEDCAHGFGSRYKGRVVGSFGEVATFSFAKLFPTYIGGAIASGNAEFMSFVQAEQQRSDTFYGSLFNSIAKHIAKKSFREGKLQFFLEAIYLKSIHFPYLQKRFIKKIPAELEFKRQQAKRRRNYHFLKEKIKRELLPVDQNPDIDPIPMYLPVFLAEEKLAGAAAQILQQGVKTEILHFDVNRNVFNQLFKKCLAIPCHQHLSQPQLEAMAAVINEQ